MPEEPPTREQVRKALADTWTDWDEYDLDVMADAVMALWSTRPATVLAEGTLLDAVHMVTGVVELTIQVPEAEYVEHLDARVQVVAVTEDPADG
jgi:hypothetical protein